MKMKLFYASNEKQIGGLEADVNAFLATIPATSNFFAVNTTSSIRDAGNVPTVIITVWYGD
jgi:hypothetical protein